MRARCIPLVQAHGILHEEERLVGQERWAQGCGEVERMQKHSDHGDQIAMGAVGLGGHCHGMNMNECAGAGAHIHFSPREAQPAVARRVAVMRRPFAVSVSLSSGSSLGALDTPLWRLKSLVAHHCLSPSHQLVTHHHRTPYIDPLPPRSLFLPFLYRPNLNRSYRNRTPCRFHVHARYGVAAHGRLATTASLHHRSRAHHSCPASSSSTCHPL
jgi:hypothetical protein